MSTIPPPPPPPPPPTLPRADNSQASSLCPQPPPPPSGDHSPHTIHADILLSTKADGNISQSHPSGVNSPKRPGDSTSSSPDFNFRSEEPTGEADPGDVVELPKQASVSVLQIASSQADVGSAHHSVSEQLMGEVEANNGVMKKSTTEASGIRGISPTVQAEHAKNPDTDGMETPESGDEVVVKTEFVWADGAENDVKLSGAWNGWMPIQMYHEGGGMWSVVTPVPAGTQEFKFVVDEEWKHSTRHPTVGDNPATMNNIRVIRGPPKQKEVLSAPTSLTGSAPPGAARPNDTASRKGCCCLS